MTLFSMITLPGAYVNAIDTAHRADKAAPAPAKAKTTRSIFKLPFAFGRGARTA